MAWTPHQMPDMNGKVAIVTGANSGIGFHTAKTLAGGGVRVVMGCRNMDKANQAVEQILSSHPHAQVRAEHLDLSNLNHVRDFCIRFKADHDHLDLLINNAGVFLPNRSVTTDGHEMHLATNHLGHFVLTIHLIDQLTAASNGRVVTVSSVAHRWAKIRFHDLNWGERYNMWEAYGQSKLANLLFTFELHRKLTEGGHSTIAVSAHPGLTTSNIMRESPWMNWCVPIVGQSADVGSWATLRAATDPDAEGGSFWGPQWCFQMWGAPTSVTCSGQARNPTLAARLWDVSEALTGTCFPQMISR